MNYMELTNKQEKTLRFIKLFYLNHGYTPTIREICVGMNVSSPSTAHLHVNKLIEKGYLEKVGGNRTYKIKGSYKFNDLLDMSKEQLINLIYDLQLKIDIMKYMKGDKNE